MFRHVNTIMNSEKLFKRRMDALCSHDPTILQPIDLSSTSEMTFKVHHQSLRVHPKPTYMKLH